jgi:hypothetical protein
VATVVLKTDSPIARLIPTLRATIPNIWSVGMIWEYVATFSISASLKETNQSCPYKSDGISTSSRTD